MHGRRGRPDIANGRSPRRPPTPVAKRRVDPAVGSGAADEVVARVARKVSLHAAVTRRPPPTGKAARACHQRKSMEPSRMGPMPMDGVRPEEDDHAVADVADVAGRAKAVPMLGFPAVGRRRRAAMRPGPMEGAVEADASVAVVGGEAPVDPADRAAVGLHRVRVEMGRPRAEFGPAVRRACRAPTAADSRLVQNGAKPTDPARYLNHSRGISTPLATSGGRRVPEVRTGA